MGILGLFKKNDKGYQPKHIDFHDNEMNIDEKSFTFPLSLNDILPLLGEPEKRECESFGNRETRYIFHNAGLVFTTCDPACVYLKYRKAFIDDEHNIVSCNLYCGDSVTPACREETLPRDTCKTVLTFDKKPITFFSGGAYTGAFHGIYWHDKGKEYPITERGIPTGTISVSFAPKRPTKSGGSYKIKPCNEDVLVFDNFNFKLAVLEVLIYELELIEPYFDIYEFAEQYGGKEIDTESDVPIRPIVNYFKKLPVPKRLAEKVEEIYMDGGNNIYMNISPQWDGEDGIFDVNSITENEIAQFPNLKKITLMSSNFDEVAKAFEQAGVTVEQL